MKWKLTSRFIVGVVLFSTAVFAQASIVTIFNNLGPNDSYNTGSASDIGRHDIAGGSTYLTVANAFTVAPSFNNITLNSIELALSYGRGSGRINVSIFDDNFGTPGASLEEFEIALIPNGWTAPEERLYKIDSIENINLVSGSQYWIVASSIVFNSEFAWYYNGLEPIFTETGPAQTYYSHNSSWVDRSHLGQQAFRVTGNEITQVPLPATFFLFVSGLSLFFSFSYRKK